MTLFQIVEPALLAMHKVEVIRSAAMAMELARSRLRQLEYLFLLGTAGFC